MKSKTLPALLVAFALTTGAAHAQKTLQTYDGASSGNGVAFGSSFVSGRFLVPPAQTLDLQGLVGDPNDGTNGANAGAVHLIQDPNASGFVLTKLGNEAGGLYGFAVANLGDQDGDGMDEWAVGAPKQNGGGSNSGSVYVYSGATGNLLKKHNGDAIDDQFGFAVAGVGDVNNDGINDYAVGAPFHDTGASNAGRVKVFSGANYNLLRTIDGGTAGDRLGSAICGIYDIDADGRKDLLIGAPYDNSNGVDAGFARAYSGKDGTTIWTVKGSSAGDRFGTSVANTGSGTVLVGAPGDDPNGTDSGSASLLDMWSGNLIRKFKGDSAGDQFGTSVAYAGQENFSGGTTYDFVIIGAPYQDYNGADSGRAYIYFRDLGVLQSSTSGSQAGELLGSCVSLWEIWISHDPWSGTTTYASTRAEGAPGASRLYIESHVFEGNLHGNAFGSAVARGGDVNNNGTPDVIIGAPEADGAEKHAGRVEVFSTAGTKVRTLLGPQADAGFGAAVGGNVDVDNDGGMDVIVGAPRTSNGSFADAGAVYVYSGKTGSLIRSHLGSAAGNQLGASVGGAGDVDGDGYGDYIVGVPGADSNGADSGRVRVFSGQTGTILYTWDGDSAGDRFGTDVSRVGDFDQDGTDDLAVGAPFHAYGGITPSTGFVRIFSAATGSVLFTLHGSATLELGQCVAGAKDVNGDGVPDVVAGARNQGTGFQLVDRGALVVYSGASGNPIYVRTGGLANQRLGISVAGLGDVNEDGCAEFAAGALADAGIFMGNGFVRIYAGVDGSTLHDVFGQNLGDHFGAAISVAGDGDSDGVLDLLVGAPGLDGYDAADCGGASILRFAPEGLATYGTATAGCSGAEVMYGNTTPSVGNVNFRITTQKSAPSSLSLGIVTDVKMGTPFDTFSLGILMNVNLYAATEIYTLDIPTDAGGRGSVPVPIPNNPGLSGRQFYGQVLSFWAAGPCSPSFTNLSSSLGLEITIP